ncbi:trichohyalin-like [Acanthaster planci]|uniref:Trichohyalin-like n=1 Tax=Acanthaster planci TaxID=133434 RepID=A0A8B7Z9W6_ACAPL|nr:trichohyalin-like [Acanthaster planci]
MTRRHLWKHSRRCTCNKYTAPEEICDSSCEQTKPTVQGSLTASGQLVVTSTANDGSGEVTTKPVPNVIGPSVHTSGTKDIQIASFDASGAMGHIVRDMADLEQLIFAESDEATTVISTTFSDFNVTSSSRRRLLQSGGDAVSVPGIANPIVCLALEDMLLFRVSLDPVNRSLSHYPVYRKDHLFNTNPTYDYSEFRDLRFYVESTEVAISSFAHVFTESGQYVFADAQEIQWEVIVSVQPAGSACDSTRSVIQPSSPANLNLQSVKKQDAMNEEPDWGLIIGMLAFLAACIIMLVIAVIVWRPRSAGIYPLKMWKPRYRALGAPPRIPPYLQYQENDKESLLLMGPRIVAGAESTSSKAGEKAELEDFNVRTLFDKLEDQTLYLSQQLARQQEDLRGFYERMSQQTDGLKGLLLSLDMSKLEKIEKERARRAEREGYQTSGDSTTIVNTSRQYNFTGASSREHELMEALQVLLDRLNSGKIPLSPEMLEQAGLASASGGRAAAKQGSVADSLLRRQNSERLELDKELRKTEEKEIDSLMTEQDKKRQQLITDLSAKLAGKLDGAETREEIDRIMAAHEKEMGRALDKFDASRQRQAEELRARLAQKRQAAEVGMKSRHQQEAREAGITLTQDDSSDAANVLKDQELEIDVILAEEALARAKAQAKQNRELAAEQQHKMSENLTAAIENLAVTGVLTAEATKDIVRDQADMERTLQGKIDKRRSQLTANMKQRMADKRRKKLRKLKQTHQEQLDASTQHSGSDSDIPGDERNEQPLLAAAETSGADELGTSADPEAIKDLQERQRKEVEALESRLEAEEAQQLKEIERQVDEEYGKELRKGHRDILDNLSKKEEVDQVLQQQLMDQLRRTNENIAYELGVQRDRQEADLSAKLNARRDRKKLEARRLAQEDAAKRLLAEQEKQREKLSEGKLVEGLQSLSPADMADLTIEEQAVLREHQRVQEDLTQRHKDEKEQLSEKLVTEAKQKDEDEAKRFNRERTKLLSEKRNKQAAELAARRGDMSEEEAGQLLASHARELEELEDRLESQRAKAQLKAREKMAERRRRLLAEQKHKQGVEMARELLEQKKELAEVKSAVVKKAEREAMLEGIQEEGVDNTEKVIRAVLEKRQAQELHDLDAQFAAERQVAIEGALTKLNDKYHGRRETLLQRHERELSDLSKAADLSPEAAEQRRAALLNQQQLELSKLEREMAQERRDIEQGALADWELRYAHGKLEMKERHYQEYADALRELSADRDNQMVSAEQAAKAAQELEEVRQKLEKEREANEEKLRKETEDFEAAEKLRMAAELADFDKSLAEEERKEKERNEKRLAALNKRKEEMVKEKEQKHKEKLEALQKSGGSKEEKDRLVEEYEKDLAKMKNKMDADRVRMQSDLEDRLKKRREERRKAKEENLVSQQEENKQDHEEKLRQEKEKMRAEEVIILKECVDTDHLLSGELAPGVAYEGMQQNAAGFPSAYASAAPLSDADFAALLMASPLYKKLEEIKRTMDDADLPPKKRGQDEPFVDDHDAGWTQDTELVPVDLSRLSPRNFVIYKFGCFVARLVATRCAHSPVTLLLAERIPVNDRLARNTYRNSYHFDDTNKILYVRQARLDTVGEFVLVLVHALAHIKTGDMRDDTSAGFTREFHQALSAVCNDLFFARYRHGTNLPAPTPGDQGDGPEGKTGQKVLAALMGGAETEAEKDEMIEKLLDVKLLRGTDSDGVHVTDEDLQKRLSKYGSFATNQEMQSLLGTAEDKIALARQHGAHEAVESRLATLTGGQTPLATKATMAAAKRAVEELPGELSGTALWQSVAQPGVASGGTQEQARKPTKGQDQHLVYLQDEVKSLEDKADRMSVEFSGLSTQVMETQDTMAQMTQELEAQKALKEGQFDESEPALIRYTTARLAEAQDKLTLLTIQRDSLSKRLDAVRGQLEEKQQQLHSYVRGHKK